MSPRKSSTSSGKRPARRPRYLGIEVAGEPFPSLSPPSFEALLREALVRRTGTAPRFRVIRSDGARGIAEVDHRDAPAARDAWNSSVGSLDLRTHRTWGTLVGAKTWLADGRDGGPGRPNRGRPRTSRS